ncbi:MAG TPA: HAD family hydrolase [Acidimicrobiales bacterium]|nr:HAD family hydrolase [Acidimicrobiales bacterium]
MRPGVFLDRDGVVNRAVVRDGRPYPPASAAELEILPGVEEACAQLRRAGLPLVVVSNQPDVVRGTTTREAVEGINRALCARVPVDDVVVCFHDDADGCTCRKPAPGLLMEAAERWSIDLTRSVMVGDRWVDVEAGRRAGCSTVWIDNGYVERRPERPDVTAASLAAAVPWILGRCRRQP